MTGDRHDCSRTRGLIDRLVAGSVRDDDRRHAATCASCGQALSRAAQFEGELERSARQLIVEDLPRGVLDPSLCDVKVVPRMPGLAPGASAGFAALALVLLVTIVGVRPVLLPGPDGTELPFGQVTPGESSFPDTPLWDLAGLSAAVTEELEFACAGDAPPSDGAEATVLCAAAPADAPYAASVTLDAAESGTLVRVTITAEIVGKPADQQAARRAVAGALAKVTAAAFTDGGAGVRAANFVFVKASQLSGPAWTIGIEESGVRIELERVQDGGFIVQLSIV